MRKLALGALLIGAMVACSSKSKPIVLNDAPNMVDAASACNVLTQTGCSSGQKCTWIVDKAEQGSGSSAVPPIGHIGCAPAGTAAVGAACTMNAAGAMGYDNCAAGAYCFQTSVAADGSGPGFCKQICDQNGGSPMCPTTGGPANLGYGCIAYDDLFGPPGMTDAAGVCDPTCDGLADNDFLTGGSAKSGHGYSTSTGNVCSSIEGCYGSFNSTGSGVTQFTCAVECGGTGSDCNLVNDSQVPAADGYTNECSQGFIPLFYSNTGHTMVECNAYCEPQDCSVGSCGSGVSGFLIGGPAATGGSGHQCLTSNARGTFDPSELGSGSADINDTRCIYSWFFEAGSSSLNTSPTSDKIGLCWDTGSSATGLGCYYDPTGGSSATTLCPKCDLLPLTGSGNVVPSCTTASGSACYTGNAGDWGCIKSAELGSGSGSGGIRPLSKHPEMGRPAYNHNVARYYR